MVDHATAAIVANKLIEMDPQYPTVTDAMRAQIEEAQRILQSEPDAPPAADAREAGREQDGKREGKQDGKPAGKKHHNAKKKDKPLEDR